MPMNLTFTVADPDGSWWVITPMMDSASTVHPPPAFAARHIASAIGHGGRGKAIDGNASQCRGKSPGLNVNQLVGQNAMFDCQLYMVIYRSHSWRKSMYVLWHCVYLICMYIYIYIHHMGESWESSENHENIIPMMQNHGIPSMGVS